MTIPWRTRTSNETPKQGFYVLKPPELLPRRCEKAEKAASQKRALPPAAFSLLHSGSIAFSS